MTVEKQVFNWLKLLKIPVSRTFLNNHMLSHPDYPSLFSITETLDLLGIDNTAMSIRQDQLHEIPVPFLAHTSNEGGNFILVNRKEKSKKLAFLKQWSGIVVIADKENISQNQENEKLLVADRKQMALNIIAVGLAILIFYLLIVENASTPITIMAVTSLLGIAVSTTIFQKELGIDTGLSSLICSGDRKESCQTLISSKKSNLLPWLKWSDVGIIYFTFSILSLEVALVGNVVLEAIQILFYLSLASICFTIYSFVFQYLIIKKPCRLCTTVIAILWIQFFLLYSNFSIQHLLGLSPAILLNTAFIFSFVGFFWITFLKPYFINTTKHEEIRYSLLRFKNSKDIFLQLLRNQSKVDTNEYEGDIKFGAIHSQLQLIVICSPFCMPCSRAHAAIHDLLREMPNKFGVTIRFAVSSSKRDNNIEVVEHILKYLRQKKLANNTTGLETDGEQILQWWYDKMNYKEMAIVFPIDENTSVEEIVDFQWRWSKENNVRGTPTVYLNGYPLPLSYRIDELKYLLFSLNKEMSFV